MSRFCIGRWYDINQFPTRTDPHASIIIFRKPQYKQSRKIRFDRYFVNFILFRIIYIESFTRSYPKQTATIFIDLAYILIGKPFLPRLCSRKVGYLPRIQIHDSHTCRGSDNQRMITPHTNGRDIIRYQIRVTCIIRFKITGCRVQALYTSPQCTNPDMAFGIFRQSPNIIINQRIFFSMPFTCTIMNKAITIVTVQSTPKGPYP